MIIDANYATVAYYATGRREYAEARDRRHIRARAGATLRFGTEVIDWTDSPGGVTVTTADRSYTGGQLVICPGARASQLLKELDIPITVERQVLYWLDPVGGVGSFENHPVFINENDRNIQIYGFPAIDGPRGGVKVAFFREGGQVCTPQTIDRVVHAEEVDAMRRRVTDLLPALSGECVHNATCMYSNTPDEHFVITRQPNYADVTVACGFSGHGFKFVPVVGEILADLATSGTTAHPIELFNTRRLVKS